jgi:hypothetical protein
MRRVTDLLRAEERRALAELDLESFSLAQNPRSMPPKPTASCAGAASRRAAVRAASRS